MNEWKMSIYKSGKERKEKREEKEKEKMNG